MNRIKIILSYLFGFILSVSIFILAIAFISKKTVLNKSFMLRLMDENNYYHNVYTSICEDIEDYMTSSGLENSVLDGVIREDKVKKDIISYTTGLYESKKYEIDVSNIKTKLKENIDSYMKELNLGMDNTNELDLFISDVAGIYSEEVAFYNTLNSLSSRIIKLGSIVDKLIIVVCVIVVLLSIIMILFRVINIGSSIMSGGIILFLFKLFLYERIDTENILLISDYFSLIIKSIFKYIGNYMINISITLICIGFIFSLFKIKKITLKK